MMTTLVIALVLLAAVASVELIASFLAGIAHVWLAELITTVKVPLGYEDEEGFHFGREPLARVKPFESVNPS